MVLSVVVAAAGESHGIRPPLSLRVHVHRSWTHDKGMNKDRVKTIAANGEVIPKPYGLGRWHSPRRYGCGHDGCTGPAEVLARADSHPVDGANRSHNCCGSH